MIPFTVRSNIAFNEFYQGITFDWTAKQVRAVRICDVDWDDHLNFVRDMLGGSQIVGGDRIMRNLPEIFPGVDFKLYAVRCILQEPYGVPGVVDNADQPRSLIKYDPGFARYAVEYSTLPFVVLDDLAAYQDALVELSRFVERHENYATEAFTLNGGTFEFTSDGRDIQERTSKIFFTKELTYIWHQIPVDDDGRLPTTLQDNIETALGSPVNSATFDGRYAAGELLFVGPEITPHSFGQFTERQVDIAYKFLYRPSGWNSLFRADTNRFAAVRNRAVPAEGIYLTSDLRALFEVG